jgi:hypothetical protein
VTLAGSYQAPHGWSVSGVVRYHSATPYTAYSGLDLNADGFTLDLPPGEHLNNRRGASFSQVDLRIGKEIAFRNNLSVELIGEVFNLLNAKNPAGFIGNRQAANFGQATTFAGDPLQGEARRAQLGLRIRF